MKPVLVNIGCGPILHHAWLNLDVEPQDSRVTRLDVRRGIPLADGTADACFSSHVIEHLSPDAASSFLQEQFRVLRPGGVIRVVAPAASRGMSSVGAALSLRHHADCSPTHSRALIRPTVAGLPAASHYRRVRANYDE